MTRLIIILTFFTNFTYGQDILIDSCGLDSSPILNNNEVKYFNQSVEKQRMRSNFDFEGKKVGFAHGNFGKKLISKKDYFQMWGKNYFDNNLHVVNQIIVLTDEEKQQSGGYDAIIVSWSKILVSGKHKKRLIKKLREEAVANNS